MTQLNSNLNEYAKLVISQSKSMNMKFAKEYLDEILRDNKHPLYLGVTVHPEPDNFYDTFVKYYRNWEDTEEMIIPKVNTEEEQFYKDIRDFRVHALKKVGEVLRLKSRGEGSVDKVMNKYDDDPEQIIQALENKKEEINNIEKERLAREQLKIDAIENLRKRRELIETSIEVFRNKVIAGEDISLASDKMLTNLIDRKPIFSSDEINIFNNKIERVDETYQNDLNKIESKRLDRYCNIFKHKRTISTSNRQKITKVQLELPSGIQWKNVKTYTDMYICVVRWVVEDAKDLSILLGLRGRIYPWVSIDTKVVDVTGNTIVVDAIDQLSPTVVSKERYEALAYDQETYLLDTHGSTDTLQKKALRVIKAYGHDLDILKIS